MDHEPIVPSSQIEPAPPQKNGRNRVLVGFTIAILALGLICFLLWFFYFRFHEFTDDAYAKGNMINLNSAISGSVIAFYADDTDLVTEGQLVVQLDPTKYQVAYDEALATLASTVLDVKKLYDRVLVNQAIVEAKRASLMTANYDYQNRTHLVSSRAISNEEFVHAKDMFVISQKDLAQAEAELLVSLDALGITALMHHPLIEQQKGNVRSSYYNLKHCSIYAPATGFIAQRFVDVGEWVTTTTAMMSVIPIDYVWVDANFKETQLTKMRIGQKATVTFDLYGSKVVYQGEVLGIAFGSGSVFSLIPPQNATGNWIKIVQRLPVRISLDPEMVKKYPIRLGISANVDVNITDSNLPMIAQMPSTKPVCTTAVFDIHMEEVEKTMDTLIMSNLEQ